MLLEARDLGHSYGARRALDGVSFGIEPGECFGVLGPNGGGKSTLFRILSTLIPPGDGTFLFDGVDAVRDPGTARRSLGVVFQSPALDKMLTGRENLRHHGHLYGLHGKELEARIAEAAEALGVADRLDDRTGRLSGGLRRRIEVAKALLDRPKLLLLDEPTHGLDPGARRDLWQLLDRFRRERGLTVAVTTHLMDEAERSDRVMILDEGKRVALDTPSALKSLIPGEVVWIETDEAEALAAELRGPGREPAVIGGRVRVTTDRGAELAGEVLRSHGDRVRSVSVARPSLEDVFLHLTGRGLGESTAEPRELAGAAS